ncbi:cytochrome P450 [Aspergillus stella-maris]|uniref:cytochrome P450 n=1 Tax=Aspergillus stella-maris TaxID=1810926 RepID=UPI003CCC9647
MEILNMQKLSLDHVHAMASRPLPAAAGLIVCILILASFLRITFARPTILVQRYQWDSRSLGSRKKRWMWDSLNLFREGYVKFYDRPWLVWTSEGDHVVLPPSAVDELKMLPDHTLPSSLREFMLPQYTFKPFAPWKLDWVNHVILHDLNKNMAKIFPGMSEEVDIALPIELPTSTEWTEVDISTQILRVICRVSGRAFVGTGLHRNDEWIDISCNYTKDLFLSALKLRAVPSITRPLLALFLPDLHRVYQHNDRARALVQSILQKRERDGINDPGYSKPNDTIQWIHDHIPDKDKRDYAYQGAAQLAITAVSVQSTSKLIVNILLNLMKYEEYVPILKEEIEAVLTKTDGHWTLESMSRLEKLDSFMRESLRFEPPLTATFQRRTLQRLKLSNGTELPSGTLVCAPADAIAFDPNFYTNPDTFDGLRFFKLRQEAEEAGNGKSGSSKASAKVRHQFVATSKTQVQFGLGRHACPGRWFAGHVIKTVVAGILLNYDLRFRDGEGKRKAFLFQTTNMPDPKTRILVRRKEKSG